MVALSQFLVFSFNFRKWNVLNMNKSQNLDLFTGLKYISYPFWQNGMTDFPTLSYTWTSEIAYPFISLKPEKVPLSYTLSGTPFGRNLPV